MEAASVLGELCRLFEPEEFTEKIDLGELSADDGPKRLVLGDSPRDRGDVFDSESVLGDDRFVEEELSDFVDFVADDLLPLLLSVLESSRSGVLVLDELLLFFSLAERGEDTAFTTPLLEEINSSLRGGLLQDCDLSGVAML